MSKNQPRITSGLRFRTFQAQKNPTSRRLNSRFRSSRRDKIELQFAVPKYARTCSGRLATLGAPRPAGLANYPGAQSRQPGNLIFLKKFSGPVPRSRPPTRQKRMIYPCRKEKNFVRRNIKVASRESSPPCIPNQVLERATIRDAANYSKSSRSYWLVVNGEMLFAGQALRWPMFRLAADAPALQLQDAAR
jgi:hypothetical protein